MMVTGGVVYGYIQVNRMAEWSAISLAAQSYAAQGAEQVRAADWRPDDYPYVAGYGGSDELPAPTNFPGAIYILDIPRQGSASNSGALFYVTNYVSITTAQTNPPLRLIRSDAVWTFFLTGKVYTNTVILLRAPDQ